MIAPDDAASQEVGMAEQLTAHEIRVLRLLSKHEGKMWQHDVAMETGWSESRTDRVLSALEADQQVVRQRIRSSTIVHFPGQSALE